MQKTIIKPSFLTICLLFVKKNSLKSINISNNLLLLPMRTTQGRGKDIHIVCKPLPKPSEFTPRGYRQTLKTFTYGSNNNTHY